MTANAAAIWLNTVFAGFDLTITTLIHKFYDLAPGLFTALFEFISFLGHDGIPMIIISAILIIFKKTRRFGTAMLLSIAVGALMTNCCFKLIVSRPRPYEDTSSIYYQFWQLVGMNTEHDTSFPSGHTTAAFALSMAIFLTGDKKKTWPAFFIGILMGISRIYLVVHYPSDVVAGTFVGLLGGCLGTLAASKIPSKFYGRDFYYLKFATPAKSLIDDDEHVEDFKTSDKIGRFTFGDLGLYWKDLGKYYYSTYDYIDKAYVKISECAEDEFSQNYSYFRLILEHSGKEFANLIIDKEDMAKEVLNALKARLD